MSNSPCAPTIANVAQPICPPAAPCPPTACTPSSYTCGDWTHSIAADCTHTRTRTSNNFTDGIYQNATITITNGCISRVVSGTNVLQSRPEPCTQNATVMPPAYTAPVISTQSCNLLSYTPGLDGGQQGLFAGLSIDAANSNVTVTGCGTPTSPLTFNAENTIGVTDVQTSTLSRTVVGPVVTLNTTGATFNQCGIQIAAGLVKNWVAPVIAVTAGAGVTVKTSPTTCSVQVSVPQKIVTGVSCGGAFIDPRTGTPPINGSWSFISATVEGARLFLHSVNPGNVFDEFGTIIGTTPSMQVFADNDAAMVALSNIYTFAGTSAC